ncbi:MAG: 16S rRNA (guanine(527)-N(7))-methyltransferase RsmG [Planctomycetes bacterium]|nr:16S rRNA (guanine(527)-N(7))-methyltransferase RsmG [Planctomycetota bacterium]
MTRGEGLEARLASGLAAVGVEASGVQIERLLAHLAAVREADARAGLVGTTDPAELVNRHVVDSAAFLGPLRGAGARSVVDVGSGAGLPGIVLAILSPGMSFLLVESRRKKAEFLAAAARALSLANVEVACGRAESLARDPRFRETRDAGVVRALARFAVAIELALPFVRPGGTLFLAAGPDAAAEAHEAGAATLLLGGAPPVLSPYHLPGREKPFHVVRIEKVRSTPDAYPRRPGIPKKRPLA